MGGLTALAIGLLVAGAPADVPPEIHEGTAYYDIRGQTAEELRNAMTLSGPLGSDGKRSDGSATWRVRYVYQTVIADGGCRLKKLKVTADISTTLPRWVDKSTAPPALVRRWEGYVKALDSYLAGHREIGRRAASATQEGVGHLPKQSECEGLDNAVASAAVAVTQEHLREDEEYARSNGQGLMQGARFP